MTPQTTSYWLSSVAACLWVWVSWGLWIGARVLPLRPRYTSAVARSARVRGLRSLVLIGWAFLRWAASRPIDSAVVGGLWAISLGGLFVTLVGSLWGFGVNGTVRTALILAVLMDLGDAILWLTDSP